MSFPKFLVIDLRHGNQNNLISGYERKSVTIPNKSFARIRLLKLNE